MIDAKSKFREGFILIKQPFKFVEGLVIQMNTIVWAYSEKPITRQELNSAGVEKLETIRHTTPPFFFCRITKILTAVTEAQINNICQQKHQFKNIH